MNKKIINFIILICCILLAVFFYLQHNFSHLLSQMDEQRIIRKAKYYGIKKMDEIWQLGDLKRPIQTACNPDYLVSVLKKNKYFQIKNKKFQLFLSPLEKKALKEYKHLPNSNTYLFSFNITYPDSKNSLLKNFVQIALEDNCHEFSLPPKSYQSLDGLNWDNKNRHFIIDSYQVSFAKLLRSSNLRKKQKERIERLLKQQPQELHSPAYGLTALEMKEYCHSQGKEILQAHLYDASAFLPKKRKTPTPWSLRSTNTFFHQAQIDPSFNLLEKDCLQAYVKGCSNLVSYYSYQENSLAWSGMSEVLGGQMEYTPNVYLDKQNLKLSNSLLPANHPWHDLRIRGTWDGNQFDLKSITPPVDELYLLKKAYSKVPMIKIGFRCMKMVQVQ